MLLLVIVFYDRGISTQSPPWRLPIITSFYNGVAEGRQTKLVVHIRDLRWTRPLGDFAYIHWCLSWKGVVQSIYIKVQAQK